MPLAFTENCLVSGPLRGNVCRSRRESDGVYAMCAANPSTVVSFDEYPGEAEVKDI